MNALLLGVAALLTWPATAIMAQDAGSGETQREINQDAAAQLKSAETDMAQALDGLMRGGKQEAIGKLRKAQAAWGAYRDAQIEALWPSRHRTLSGGSILPACVAFARAALTEARTKELRAMSSAEEGDTCASEWSQ